MNTKAKAVLFAAAAAVIALCIYFQRVSADVGRLRVDWAADGLHVHSSKDGPWIVTHLATIPSGSNAYAVAQLPLPATIIDSRGERFSVSSIQSLPWVLASGERGPAPKHGDAIQVFYFVPLQSKPSQPKR